MGLSLLRLLPQFPEFRLHAAVVGPQSGSLGRDTGELAGVGRSGIQLGADLEGALPGAALALAFSTALAAPQRDGFKDLDGSNVSLADQAGHTVVLAFLSPNTLPAHLSLRTSTTC